MTTLHAPPQPGKLTVFADRFPAFLTTISLGMIPRTPLPVIIDIIAMVVWVAISTIPFPQAVPLRYLLVGYFLMGLLRHPNQLLPVTFRSWPLFIIPVMMLISATWAPFAGDAIKKGVYLAMTGFFAIYLGTRLSARQLVFAYFFIETVAMLMSLATPHVVNGDATGIFGQKNYLAVHMFILYASSMAIILDNGMKWPLRLVALGSAPLAVVMILWSHSATTLVFILAATVAFLGQAMIWQPARRVAHMRALIVLTAVLIVSLAAYAVFGLSDVNLYNKFLEAMGKDSTLTGRTYLWDQAWRLMDENPMTGLGGNGFWRPEVGQANSILGYFFYDRFTIFSFHNSYLETGVQLGYPGMYVLICVAAWALFYNARNWFTNQNTTNTFFLVLASLTVLRSNTEIDLISEFSTTMVLLFIGAVRRDRVSAPAPVSPIQAPSQPQPGLTPARARVSRPT